MAKFSSGSSKNILDLKRTAPRTPPPAPRKEPPTPRSDPRRRGSTLRARRQKERALWVLVILLFIASAVYGVSYISYLPQFTIATITVVGNQVVSAAAVHSAVESVLYNSSNNFLSHQNIFLYPKVAIEQSLVADFPRIASATVSRPAPLSRTLTVTVTERKPYALWCETASSSSCYLMDKGGFIFAASATSTPASGEYVFTGGIATSSPVIGQTFAPGHIPGIVALFQLLKQQDSLAPLGASVQNDQDFDVTLAQGFYIKAAYGEDAGTLANDLQLVLGSQALQGQESNLEYVDMRFGSRVYYKFKGQAQQQAG